MLNYPQINGTQNELSNLYYLRNIAHEFCPEQLKRIGIEIAMQENCLEQLNKNIVITRNHSKKFLIPEFKHSSDLNLLSIFN